MAFKLDLKMGPILSWRNLIVSPKSLRVSNRKKYLAIQTVKVHRNAYEGTAEDRKVKQFTLILLSTSLPTHMRGFKYTSSNIY